MPLAVRDINAELFWSKVDKAGPRQAHMKTRCYQWTGSTDGGSRKGSYPRGRLTVRGKKQFAHRISWALSRGRPIPVGKEVCHRCDNALCVRPSHLVLATHAWNVRDMVVKDRWGKRERVRLLGERNGLAKLTSEKVREIRSSSKSQRALAKQFGVSTTVIQHVRSRQTWTHVN